MMLYNGVELPKLPDVPDENYKYIFILGDASNEGAYYLQVLYYRPHFKDGFIMTFATNSYMYSCGLSNGGWAELRYSSGPYKYSVESYPVIWASFDILNEDGSVYLAASAPVDPNAPTGTMEIISTQVLDDSASFVVSVAGLSSTESVYSFRYELYSGGALVSSHDHSEVFAGPSDMLHATIPNLSPQTEYEIVFSLLDNGVETGLSVSTTFTTLAVSVEEDTVNCECPSILSAILDTITEQSDFLATWYDVWFTRMNRLEENLIAAITAICLSEEETALKGATSDVVASYTEQVWSDEGAGFGRGSVTSSFEVLNNSKEMFDTGYSVSDFFDFFGAYGWGGWFTADTRDDLHTVPVPAVIDGYEEQELTTYEKNLLEIQKGAPLDD